MIRDGIVTVTVDDQATRSLYGQRSAADNCTCRGCTRFATQHDNAYPAPFRALLGRLGIDASLPNEVITYGGEDEPPVFVEGTYDFVGSVEPVESVDQLTRWPNVPGSFHYRFNRGWGMPTLREFADFEPISHILFGWFPPVASVVSR
jgi:hypothetical protein